MDYQQLGTDVKVAVEQKELEVEINNLWEKIKKTSEIIYYLREENRQLKEQYDALLQRYEEMIEKFAQKEQEVTRIRTEYLKIMNTASSDAFTPQEKEALRNRINELIAKINSHL